MGRKTVSIYEHIKALPSSGIRNLLPNGLFRDGLPVLSGCALGAEQG